MLIVLARCCALALLGVLFVVPVCAVWAFGGCAFTCLVAVVCCALAVICLGLWFWPVACGGFLSVLLFLALQLPFLSCSMA